MTTTGPRGFRAAGVAAGIKANGDLDVALVVNDGPLATVAAVFTSNVVRAACVAHSERVIGTGTARAVVLNSGCANACTGAQGEIDALETANHTARILTEAELPTTNGDVVVCSTGLIGMQLPLDKVLSGIDTAAAALSTTGGGSAASAILTTDSHAKTATWVGDGWSIGGMAKGAGMLAPGLATMLVVITTDAHVGPAGADSALRAATALTFDRLDSDGCMSTNDTVVLMASGASGVVPSGADLAAGLLAVCDDLAQQLLADAEGAEHCIGVTVDGAQTEADALTVARAIARSNLLKAAIFGRDPNWGRVAAAAGAAGVTFDPSALSISVAGTQYLQRGEPTYLVGAIDTERVAIDVTIGAGPAAATVWTNDLTLAYVRENSEYSS